MKSKWLFFLPLLACLMMACQPEKADDNSSKGTDGGTKKVGSAKTETPAEAVVSEKPGDVAALEEGLEVGMLAPEIKGEDIDGEVFALSDYRGKVVLLDFWGDW